MKTNNYIRIPISPLLTNRLHSLIREYSHFTKEIQEYKEVVDGFSKQADAIMADMKDITLERKINVNEKYKILDSSADELSKIAYKRDNLVGEIVKKQQKYIKELAAIGDAIKQEKPDFTDEEVAAYIEAFTSTLSKNILDK